MLQCVLVYKSSGGRKHGLLLHTHLGVDCSVRVTGEKALSFNGHREAVLKQLDTLSPTNNVRAPGCSTSFQHPVPF